MAESIEPNNGIPVPPEGAQVDPQPEAEAHSNPVPEPIPQEVADQQAAGATVAPPSGEPVIVGQPPKAGETAALVLGILSIVFSGLVGLVLGIIGLNKSKRALAILPDNGKAKGGKVCSIIGIVFSAIALVASIVLTVLGVGIIGTLVGEDAAIKDAARTTLEESFNPSAEKRAQTVKSFDSAFEASANVSFSELGISSDEFASWLYDGASYEIMSVNFNEVTGTKIADVDVKVTTHSLASMEQNINSISSSLDANAFANATTESEVYKVVGDIVKQAMAETPLTTKDLTLVVVKKDDTWQVDKTEAANFVIEAFTS